MRFQAVRKSCHTAVFPANYASQKEEFDGNALQTAVSSAADNLCVQKKTERQRREMKRVKRQKEDRKGKAQAGYKGPENTARDAEDG